MPTNFKCMYLIDDRLYKDAILNKQSSIMNLNNNINQSHISERQPDTYFAPNNLHHPLSNLISKPNPENEKPKEAQQEAIENLTVKSQVAPNLVITTQKVPNKETQFLYDTNQAEAKNEPENMVIDSSPKNEKCSCDRTEAPSGKRSIKKPKMNIKRLDKKPRGILKSLTKSSEVDKNNTNSIDEIKDHMLSHKYDQTGPIIANDIAPSPSKTKPPPHQPESNGRRIQNKKRSSNVKYFCTYCGERFFTRSSLTSHVHDIHQKSRNLKRNDLPSLEGGKDNISFICSICNSRFKRFRTLHRHMSNIHPDYFGEWSNQNKRANDAPTPSKNKKAKWDGRMKRKIEPTEDKPDKRVKKEFKCFFCDQHFRSEFSLERHEKAIHAPSTRTEKRKKVESDLGINTYSKRLKANPKKAIQYSNYF